MLCPVVAYREEEQARRRHVNAPKIAPKFAWGVYKFSLAADDWEIWDGPLSREDAEKLTAQRALEDPSAKWKSDWY